MDHLDDGEDLNLSGTAPAETILGATGHVNVIDGIADGDVAYGGDLDDTIVIANNYYDLVDGQGGANTLHLQDVEGDTEYYNLAYGVHNFSTVVLDNLWDNQGVSVELNVETVLALNGGSTVSVQMYGSTDAADLVNLYAGESNWAISMSADTRTIHTEFEMGPDLASVDLSATEGREDHMLLTAHSSWSTTVSAQYFDSGTVSYWSDEGSDYVFGANLNRNDIGNIASGDQIYGGSLDDTFQATDTFDTLVGGAGDDSLTLERGSDSMTYNLVGRLSGVENITLHGVPGVVGDGYETPGYEGGITLHLSDLEVGSANGSTIHILGDSDGDDILLEGNWTQSGANSYTSSYGATVTVEDVTHITVVQPPPPDGSA